MATLLPPELWDTIIDQLSEDHHTLANCALVCSNWLPAVRSHIFRRLNLGNDVSGCECIFDGPNTLKILSCVKSIFVVFPNTDEEDFSRLLSYLPILPCVEKIHLQRARMRHIQAMDLPRILTDVKSLSLKWILVEELKHILCLATNARQLSELRIEDCDFDLDYEDIRIALERFRPPPLTHLHMMLETASVLIEWNANWHIRSEICSLALIVEHAEDDQPIFPLEWMDLKPSITHLHLKYHQVNSNPGQKGINILLYH